MKTVYGIFEDPEAVQRAVDGLAAAGERLHFEKRQIVVISGEPYDGYDFSDEHAHTRLFQLAAIGAFVGGTCGYWLTSLTQRAYPIPTGGMPIVPAWTNGIIIYELTMLGAIITTVITLLASARLPRFEKPLTNPGIWEGKILVGVAGPAADCRGELETLLRQAGAAEIKEFE